MKYLISLLVVCLGSGCASRKESTRQSDKVVPKTSISAKGTPSVRTPEVVKAYPLGRYTDPNYPDEMHERHTVYRREQSPDWNYLPDPPYSLPMGPSTATSNPSPSYYAKAEGELNGQQKAYAEALQEQNRVMKQRIESLQQEAGKVPELKQEIDRLKKQTEEALEPPAAPAHSEPTKADEADIFSSIEAELPDAPSDQDFLISQMRLNDEFVAELDAAERRKISNAINGQFFRRGEIAFSTNKSR